ncbi:hypothetical protein PM082_024208 [Marasmius tenuissimus]|nr:hypothetical protein PM082_024208 [Marasmius tenuissimus]
MLYTSALIAITILANILTEVILIWRCYLVWGRGRLGVAVSVVPALIALDADVYCIWVLVTKIQLFYHQGTNNPSIVNTHDRLIGIFALLALTGNLMFTVLIAGKILFVAYRVGKSLPACTSIPRMYETIISATLESGMIYPIALSTYAAGALSSDSNNFDQFTSDALLAQSVFYSLVTIMGIASTLIIVRITLGVAIHDEKSFKETIMNMKEIDLTQGQRHTSYTITNSRRRNTSHTQETYHAKSLTEVASDLEAQKMDLTT